MDSNKSAANSQWSLGRGTGCLAIGGAFELPSLAWHTGELATQSLAGRVADTMRNGLLVVIGVLLVVVGITWTLQGIGVVGGSVMTGVTAWAVIGPFVAVLGAVMMTVGLRGRRSAP